MRHDSRTPKRLRYPVVLAALGVLALAVGTTIASDPTATDWTENLSMNLLTEILGIFITVLLIQRLISEATESEQRRLSTPFALHTVHALRELQTACTHSTSLPPIPSASDIVNLRHRRNLAHDSTIYARDLLTVSAHEEITEAISRYLHLAPSHLARLDGLIAALENAVVPEQRTLLASKLRKSESDFIVAAQYLTGVLDLKYPSHDGEEGDP